MRLAFSVSSFAILAFLLIILYGAVCLSLSFTFFSFRLDAVVTAAVVTAVVTAAVFDGICALLCKMYMFFLLRAYTYSKMAKLTMATKRNSFNERKKNRFAEHTHNIPLGKSPYDFHAFGIMLLVILDCCLPMPV